MKKISLKDFAGEMGQEKAAQSLGVRQSAISKALRAGRDIFVIIHPDGRFEAKELKTFPSQQKAESRAI
ncbi:hypothetical protein V3510_002800 [Serratia marcescens]|uniref:Cro/CI family transcriptional regulator n=1 Tax=Serratia marcescens TaxID=615 RepID=UPI0007455DE8|nr:Cro/CI family transcriptional regulator [Serratia marcescens]EME1466532.1 hypothetical protein [Serratia marcescens]RJK63716.1 hypothetical protein CMV60_19985 [Serratia marcescens]CVG70483.1 Cro [Serratia marcescens]